MLLLGVNLKATHNGGGAYCDSFFRSDKKTLHSAESSGMVSIGDLITKVDDCDVTSLPIDEIKALLLKNRSICKTVTFVTPKSGSLTFEAILGDFRMFQWFIRHIECPESRTKVGLALYLVLLLNHIRKVLYIFISRIFRLGY